MIQTKNCCDPLSGKTVVNYNLNQAMNRVSFDDEDDDDGDDDGDGDGDGDDDDDDDDYKNRNSNNDYLGVSATLKTLYTTLLL